MINVDPINERYERQKDKIDRLHVVLEDIYNETHYFEEIGALIGDTKAKAHKKIDDYVASLDRDITDAEVDAVCSDASGFATNLLLEVETEYVRLNDHDLQEYVDKLFESFIRCLSEDVLKVGKKSKEVLNLTGIMRVKPFVVQTYDMPDITKVVYGLTSGWTRPYHVKGSTLSFMYFHQIERIIDKVAATFKYHAIKEFMEAYNATMYTMMSIQNRTTEQLIMALQAMERL